jgi:hypothetical protein
MATPIVQLLHQPGHRDLPLVVLRQHETAQLRPEMARHTRWQRRNHRPSIRRNPALAAIADGPNPQHNILHHEILVSLEAGTRRDLQRKQRLLDADPWRHLAAAAPAGTHVPPLRRRSLLHATRLDIGATFQALQSRNLLAQLHDSSLLFRVLAQQLQHKLLKLRVRQARNLGWGGHNQPESNCPVSPQANSQPLPGLLPLLPVHRKWGKTAGE